MFYLLVTSGFFLLYFIHLIVEVKTVLLRVDFRANKFAVFLKINALLFAYNIKLLYICSVRNEQIKAGDTRVKIVRYNESQILLH